MLKLHWIHFTIIPPQLPSGAVLQHVQAIIPSPGNILEADITSVTFMAMQIVQGNVFESK